MLITIIFQLKQYLWIDLEDGDMIWSMDIFNDKLAGKMLNIKHFWGNFQTNTYWH